MKKSKGTVWVITLVRHAARVVRSGKTSRVAAQGMSPALFFVLTLTVLALAAAPGRANDLCGDTVTISQGISSTTVVVTCPGPELPCAGPPLGFAGPPCRFGIDIAASTIRIDFTEEQDLGNATLNFSRLDCSIACPDGSTVPGSISNVTVVTNHPTFTPPVSNGATSVSVTLGAPVGSGGPTRWNTGQFIELRLEFNGACPDHFKCYSVQGETLNATVSLSDQFEDVVGVKVMKPKLLCNPVDKNGEGIPNPFAHLVCYEITEPPPRFPTDGIFPLDVLVNNQFGEAQLKVKAPELLCVPSTKKENLPCGPTGIRMCGGSCPHAGDVCTVSPVDAGCECRRVK